MLLFNFSVHVDFFTNLLLNYLTFCVIWSKIRHGDIQINKYTLKNSI